MTTDRIPTLDPLSREFARLLDQERGIRQNFPGALEAVYKNALEHEVSAGELCPDPTPMELFAFVHANNRLETEGGEGEDDPDVLVCHAHYKCTGSYMIFRWNPTTQDWEE
jgi:hypothetical protein